jgi:hypothetical protein
MPHRRALWAGLLAVVASRAVPAQRAGATAAPADSVIAITPPRTPLPPENATAAVTKFAFIAYGDTRGEFDGLYPNTAHLSVVSEMVRRIRQRAGTDSAIKFIVQSGDAVVDGRSALMLDVSYVPVINQLTGVGDVPYFLAVGNHDVRSSPVLTDTDRVKGLKNYFAANAKLIPPEGSARRLNGYPTYAVAYGNTFVILYDSQIAGDSVQYDWVRRQLEGLDRRRYVNVVAVCHHPTFSSGPHGGATVEQSTQIIRDKYMPLFRKHHVRLLLTGHEHLFEHWYETYTDSTGRHRLDEIVSGGGGAPLYGYHGEPDVRGYEAQYRASQVRVTHLVRPAIDPGANPFHFIVVNVDGPRLTLQVVAPYWGSDFAPYRSNTVTIAP